MLAFLSRWGEALAAGAAVALGLWIFSLGGWILAPAGVAIILIAAAWLLLALRRLRFRRPVTAPGMVEVVEERIRYYGAQMPGGELSLHDLAEIRIMAVEGRLHWRLRTGAGEALLVPLDAAGAGALPDAFAALPGASLTVLSRGVAEVQRKGGMRVLWRMPDDRALT